jgi:SET domain-containing protein
VTKKKSKISRTTLERKAGLYLKDTLDKGRGVFCTTDIKKGETLEITPALILNEKATDRINKTLLLNYVFSIGKISKHLLKKKTIRNTAGASCIVMGIGSFCNHSEKPNAEIVWEEENKTLYYSLQATKAIPKGTEICTSYGDIWFDDRKV